jgi:hypothetical protein
VGAELLHADRRTDMILIVAFPNFAKAPKNSTFCLQSVSVSFVWLGKTNSTNWLVFITEVYLLRGTSSTFKYHSGKSRYLILVKIVPLCCFISRNVCCFHPSSKTIYLLYIKTCYMFRLCLYAIIRQYNTRKHQYVNYKIVFALLNT